jgi:hypothetical protein
MSDFKHYYLSLSKDEREDYAARVGTTTDYIECHLLAARKVPRPKLMNALAKESNNNCSLGDLALFFNSPKEQAA